MSTDAHPGDGHLEYEQLAVEHVLGGLDIGESSRFRDHLIGCEQCRRRVAELRGIAFDLQVAAREERAVVRTMPAVEHDRDEGDDVGLRERASRLGAATAPLRFVAMIVLACLVTILAFWNLHLREVQDQLAASARSRYVLLDVLLTGDQVPLTTVADDLQVQVAVRGDVLGINAQGIRTLDSDERVVLWGIGATGQTLPLAIVRPDDWAEGRLLLTVDLDAAVDIVLSIESSPLANSPGAERLFTATVHALA